MGVARVGVVYLVGQALTYAVDLGSFLLIGYYFNASPVAANISAKIFAGLFSFTYHRQFSFSGGFAHGLLVQAATFAAIVAGNSIATSLLLTALMSVVPSVVAAKCIADLVLIAASFVLTRSLVFRHRPADDTTDTQPKS